MERYATTLITLGALFVFGMGTDFLGRRTIFPRATLLILLGVALGPAVFDILPKEAEPALDAASYVALVMIGFLLGEEFTLRKLRRYGNLVIVTSLTLVLVSAVVLIAGLLLIGAPLEVALLLAAASTATDPVATVDVAHEVRAQGPFTRLMQGIVAVDDFWGVIYFSATLVVIHALLGHIEGVHMGFHLLRDVGGAALLGACIGVPGAYLTGRIRAGEPTLLEALTMVFLCTGLALWFNVSFLIAAMVTGALVANLARHHSYPFHAIEGIEGPFIIVFFIVAGARLDSGVFAHIGILLAAYVVLRAVGRFVGGALGARLAKTDGPARRWLGLALLPQAGVALGMAVYAEHQLPEIGRTVLPTVIVATVLFEIAGPILTRVALRRVGETGQRAAAEANVSGDAS